MNNLISLYTFYKGQKPDKLERGAIVFEDQGAIMMTTYSLLGLRDFHPLRIEVAQKDVYMITEGVFALLEETPTFESEEFT